MPLRNDSRSYGWGTKVLHWLTVGAVTAQFVVGYAMRGGDDSGRGGGGPHEDGSDDGDDHSGPGAGASLGMIQAVARLDRGHGSGSDDFAAGHPGLLSAHVALGVAIIVLTAVRLGWRLSGSLPEWAPELSTGERRLQGLLERCLYGLLFVVPASGLALVFASGEDVQVFGVETPSGELADDDVLLTVHIAMQIAFFVVVGLHIGLVLKHLVVNRDRLLQRML
jgi:cytochrome b561